MGYEVILLIGEERTESFMGSERTKDHNYFRTFATIDMCKIGRANFYDLFQNIKGQNPVYFYPIADMHNDDFEVVEDCYGAKMYTVPLADVLEALRCDCNDDDYRRFRWAEALLDSMETDDLKVIIWGH